MDREWIKIPDVLFFQEGPGVRNTQYTTEGVKLLNVANLVGGKVDLSTSERYISNEEAYGKYKHFLCDEGDFIVASSGIKVEYIDKKMGFIDKSMLPLCMNTSTIRFKVLNQEQLRIRYFMYYLKSQHFKGQLAKQITGSAQLNYGPSHLKQMIMPLITVDEQDDIVEKLDKIQAIIDLRKREIEKLDELIKARFVEMFGVNDENWDEVSIADVCIEVRTGPFGSALHHDEFVDEGVFVLGIDNAVENKFSYNRMRYITEEKYQLLKRYTVNPEDVIITIMGTVGRSAVIPKDIPKAINTKHLACLTPNKELINSYFLCNAFQLHPLIRMQLEGQAKGAIMNGLNLAIIRNLRFKLPPLGLQKEFVVFYHQTTKSKAVVQKSLDETQLLFNSLMQQYFG